MTFHFLLHLQVFFSAAWLPSHPSSYRSLSLASLYLTLSPADHFDALRSHLHGYFLIWGMRGPMKSNCTEWCTHRGAIVTYFATPNTFQQVIVWRCTKNGINFLSFFLCVCVCVFKRRDALTAHPTSTWSPLTRPFGLANLRVSRLSCLGGGCHVAAFWL